MHKFCVPTSAPPFVYPPGKGLRGKQDYEFRKALTCSRQRYGNGQRRHSMIGTKTAGRLR